MVSSHQLSHQKQVQLFVGWIYVTFGAGVQRGNGKMHESCCV
jgi:hypothetical protein